MATATASKTEEMLIDWLRDAHAMEKHAEQVLSSTASRIENYPELKTQLERHAEQTRRQADGGVRKSMAHCVHGAHR